MMLRPAASFRAPQRVQRIGFEIVSSGEPMPAGELVGLDHDAAPAAVPANRFTRHCWPGLQRINKSDLV
jgi:hypothetical protein